MRAAAASGSRVTSSPWLASPPELTVSALTRSSAVAPSGGARARARGRNGRVGPATCAADRWAGHDLDRRRAGREARPETRSPQRRGGSLDRDDTPRPEAQPLAAAPVEAANHRHRALVGRPHLDHTERLREVELRGEEGRHGSRTAVERVVAAPDPDAAIAVRRDRPRQRPRHGGTVECRCAVDAHRPPRTARQRFAQRLLGGRRTERDHRDRRPGRIAVSERPLQRGPVGLRHPGEPVVGVHRAGRVGLRTQVDPLEADGDHRIPPLRSARPLTCGGRRRRDRPRGRST